jgi:hypothetical protein
MRQTEAWWVCNKCDKPVAKKGSKGVHVKMLGHRKVCHKLSCYSIKQVTQGEGRRK